MGSLRYKLAQFMYGRHGMDELSYGMFAIYLVLLVLNTFLHTTILQVLIWVIIFLTVFRTLSKNIYKRRLENEKFLKVWKPLKSKGAVSFRRIKEIKTHRYRKCPHCKSTLRLPKKTGTHTVKCPRCSDEFKVKIIF